MPVERAPYIEYNEATSYLEGEGNGSEIPLLIIKSNNVVNVADITPNSILTFKSYNNFKKHYGISSEESVYAELDESVKELDVLLKEFFMENSMYGTNEDYGLLVPYIYVIDIGNNPTVNHYEKALEVSEVKRNSTVVLFPNTEDINFMKSVRDKLMVETKDGLLRIAYFGITGEGKLTSKFAKGNVVKPTFNHHGFIDVVDGYLKVDTENNTKDFYKTSDYAQVITKNENYVYHNLADGKYFKYVSNDFVETTLNALDGYSEVIEGFERNNTFFEDAVYETEIPLSNESAIYLMKTQDSKVKAYTVKNNTAIPITVLINENELLYDNDDDYNLIIPSTKKEFGGTDENFDEFCERMQFISQEVQSSRVAIVEKEYLGKTIARICSTPYYIEPAYLPYLSVPTGVFKERTKDERDSLFASGLIFNEDDYTLSVPTPRMCLATSTAWGVEDHYMRTTDSLLHARRNVDYHVRNILKIIAPQLKRNETSVNLRHVKTQIDLYLNNELQKGTIQEYSFDLVESSYNPYALLLQGRITPVNSTLSIEFENTVGSPYAIASDYV